LLFKSIAGAVVSVMALTGAASPDAPPGAPGTVVPDGSLVLWLREASTDEGPMLAQAMLQCGPDGGTHPRPREACQALASVAARFDELPRIDRVCSMIYQPVVAEANGVWRGQPVHFGNVYPNSCVAAAATSNVFSL